MPRRRSATAALTIVIAAVMLSAVMLSGCSAYYIGEGSPSLTTASVQGTWTHAGPRDTAATFTFASDGTFRATNIPLIAAPPSGTDELHVYWNDAKDGAGTWAIRSGDSEAGTLDLRYDADSLQRFEGDPADDYAGNYSTMFSIEQDKVVGLFLTAGDPDEKYRLVFHRTTG